MSLALTPVAPSLRKEVVLECRGCGFEEPTRFVTRCPRCGGPTDVLYDLSRATVRDDPDPMVRWFDLLPLADTDRLHGVGHGGTPLVHARELGAAVGLRQLHLKYEGANPTRTTKDRMAGVALSFLAQRGVREFVVSSTGNSSTSMGVCAAAAPEIRLHIFCGADFVDRVNIPDAPNVTVYCTDTDFVGAAKLAAAFARDNGLPFEGGFFNPGRREGLKLAYLEAFDQLAPREPDVVVQAVSSGMGIYGAYKGVVEYRAMGRLRGLPRIVCAQQQRCAPMYRAFHDGAETLRPEHVEPRPEGIAKAILRGDPSDSYPYLRAIMVATGGTVEAVPDEEILAAQRLALDLEGLEVCLSSSVALASALRLARAGWIGPEQTVLVNLTGADRPAVPPRRLTHVESVRPVSRTTHHAEGTR